MMVVMERVDRDSEERSKWSRAQRVLVALLLVGLLTAIFVLQNNDMTEVSFLFWSIDVPLSGALLLAAALGGIITFLVTYARRRVVLRTRRDKRDPDSRPPITEK
jgi:uncharacterized integral membrane protein